MSNTLYTYTSSGDEVAEYTYNDLRELEWDDGGYQDVLIYFDGPVGTLAISSDVVSVIEGYGISPNISIGTLSISSDVVSVIEGQGTDFTISRGILTITPNDTIQSVSSNIDIWVQDLTLDTLVNEVFTSSNISSEISVITISPLDNNIKIDSNIDSNISSMELIPLQAIIPTWRLPYVGCEETLFPTMLEEVTILRLNEEVTTITIDSEDIILNIDC